MSKSRKTAAILLGGTTLTGVAAARVMTGTPPAKSAPASSAIRMSFVPVGRGVNLRVVERGRDTGMPVILLHGLSDSWASFSLLMEHLPLEMRLIAVDMRGHGASSKPVGEYSMKVLAGDVVALMDALGIRSARIIGHSMGSLVAQQVAAQHPDRVKALVLLGAARSGRGFTGIDQMDDLFRGFTDVEAPVPEAFAREFQLSTAHAAVPAHFMDSAVAASLQLPVRVWNGLLASLAKENEAKVTSSVPTLVLWGDKDAYLDATEQSQLTRKWQAQFVALPETGHALHWERPAEVAKEILRFIHLGM